jgi:surface polysaccharide O-acyltransferase-like enzyme
MLFILFQHFIVHGLKIAGYWGEDISNIGVILNSHFIIAVNCFILISGYFSIKPSIKGLVHLYLFCFFYKAILNAFSIVYNDEFSFKVILSSFFPFSHGLWFITVYVYLYLLSPLLNHLISKINKKEYLSILFSFCLLTFYFGFFWRGAINNNGYNIMNFIFLYLIGRFIALYTKNQINIPRRIIYLSIYFICSFMIAGFVIAIYRLNLKRSWIPSLGYPYNSPLVIMSSISFFLFFRTLKIKSKIINWFASSILAVYLIHENPIIGQNLYEYISSVGGKMTNRYLLAGYFFILACGIMIACVFIDKIRILVMKPLENIIGRIEIQKKLNKIIDKIECILK